MTFPVPLYFSYALCVKCGPHMRHCTKQSDGACRYPKVYFYTKKSYEVEKLKWTRRGEERRCDFSSDSKEKWDCFEDEWID